MRYISTRGGGSELSFSDVLLEGLAPDGGLYVPKQYPHVSRKQLVSMQNWSYNQIAFQIIRLFVGDSIKGDDLKRIIAKSYTASKFGSLDITPIQPLGHKTGLLKLSNGPTLAFKDVALQLVANLMEHVLAERDEYLNILAATSGDTGSSAEEAVRGKKRLRIFMLSPFGRMSLFQQKQMYTIDDPNIFNLVPNGNFDECQAAVKMVNGDADFKRQNSIGAMNSINWARIMAQVVYYVYGCIRTVQHSHELLTVVVPSGNFGNALAAYVAAKMGLPIHIVVATNENDILHQFFKTGVYRVRNGEDVKTTSSPSMDIASASNFERFMFDYVGRDPQQLRKLWQSIDTTGEFEFDYRFTRANGGVWISSGSATDAEVIETIQMVFNRYGIIVDPHTAVALKVGSDQCRRADLGPILFAETAQPAKFAEVIKEALGITMPIPVRNQAMFDLKEKITRIEETDPSAIADAVKKFMVIHSR